MELFKLFGVLEIKDDGVEAKLDSTEAKAEKVGSKFSAAGKNIVKYGAMAAAGAAAAGAAIWGIAQKSADTTDRIDKMSQKIGISRKGFQEWEYIMSQNGMSIDGLQMGMKALVNSFDSAKDGTESSIKSFERLGYSMEDLKGLDQEQLFDATIKGLMGIEDPAERAALANKLLGRSGAELAPLLNSGADSVDELRARAHELGIVLSDEAVDAGVLLTDTIDDVKRSFGAIVTQIGTSVMPMVQTALEWIKENMPLIQNVVGTVFTAIGAIVKTAVAVFTEVFLPAIQWVIDFVVDNWPLIRDTIKTVLEAVQNIITTITDKIKSLWEKHGETILNVASKTWEAIKVVIDTVLKVVKGIIDVVMGVITGDWSRAWEGIKSILSTVWGGIKSVVTSATDVVKNLISNAWESVKSKTKATWESIKEAIKKPIDAAKDAVKNAIDKIKGFFNFSWSLPKLKLPHLSITGKFGISPPSVPKFSIDWWKTGALLNRPTMMGFTGDTMNIGGEAGAEGLMPLEGKHMMPFADAVASRLGRSQEINNTFNIAKLVVREESDIKKIARELQKLQEARNRGRGLAYE